MTFFFPKRRPKHRNGGIERQRNGRGRFIALASLVFVAIFTSQARAQTTSGTSTNTAGIYKKMTLEQLMDLDVTSVSKEPEPYKNAPAAIQVITGD